MTGLPELPAFSHFLENSTHEMQRDAIRVFARAYAEEAVKQERERSDGARRWLTVVQQKADGARQNAQALRKFPGQEHEARARELAAMYLLETAQFMAMEEVHAEMLASLRSRSEQNGA